MSRTDNTTPYWVRMEREGVPAGPRTSSVLVDWEVDQICRRSCQEHNPGRSARVRERRRLDAALRAAHKRGDYDGLSTRPPRR